MSTLTRTIRAGHDRVWEVLTDGWAYPLFVVGASRMRAVDGTWPDVGARIHHSIGMWPALIDDYTEVKDVDWGQRLVLRAKAWPLGEARVEFRLRNKGMEPTWSLTRSPPPDRGVSCHRR